MKAVIQRAKRGKVTVSDQVVGSIESGLVVLLGVTHDDTSEDAQYLANKIVNLRIFEDEDQKMNNSLLDQQGQVLSISQFTLYSDTRKGRRPNFMEAAKPDQAKQLYETFNDALGAFGVVVETGVFGEMMDVELVNDGPVTITIDSEQRNSK
ncbi:D-tyrosyl-tRNA(Tyr) deacylase [Pelagirhabdus alkalitolerans]|uniref:D-aminoacyl-tRNA deacylase n=1 Tax=Pelagirhabdus alkalitolerans TaxID=1612202 RepID=A0A1G6HR60_9BACI|nr:D-aminoacyl-tRNA deacylase [Pelagirhabdus alkalitolerans]SDB96722.1 D-tyrosyl-tRNA(Tyr) deacylase [Pelagirhabdus alkalitolerans]